MSASAASEWHCRSSTMPPQQMSRSVAAAVSVNGIWRLAVVL
jgi:hypothetical protein